MSQARARELGLVEGVFALCTAAIFVAVTVPSFLEFVARQRQREARDTLLDFYTGARAHFLAHGTYACGDCGVRPAHKARYSYDFGDGQGGRGGGRADGCAARAAPFQAAGRYRAVAAAPVDGGRACEVWSIDEAMRLVRVPPAPAAP